MRHNRNKCDNCDKCDKKYVELERGVSRHAPCRGSKLCQGERYDHPDHSHWTSGKESEQALPDSSPDKLTEAEGNGCRCKTQKNLPAA